MLTWPAILLLFGEGKYFTGKLVWQPNNHSWNPSVIRPHLSCAPELVLSPLGICVVTCVSADNPAVWIRARIPASLKETEISVIVECEVDQYTSVAEVYFRRRRPLSSATDDHLKIYLLLGSRSAWLMFGHAQSGLPRRAGRRWKSRRPAI